MKTIILSIIICLLLTSCIHRDSIYNHKGEVIIEITSIYNTGDSKITTRVNTKDGYRFKTFRVYNSELVGLTINDTIK